MGAIDPRPDDVRRRVIRRWVEAQTARRAAVLIAAPDERERRRRSIAQTTYRRARAVEGHGRYGARDGPRR